MKKNKTSNGKKKAPAVLRVLGVILLMAAVFAVVFVLLLSIRESYVLTEPSSVSSAVEKQIETGTEDPADEQTVPQENQTETEAPAEETAAEPVPAEEAAPAYQEMPPAAEDGSGSAGLMTLSEGIRILPNQDGWYRDEYNAWYSPDTVLGYYNGWVTLGEQQFHFDTEGRVDRGWKTIGGQDCYFDETGVYQPDAVRE